MLAVQKDLLTPVFMYVLPLLLACVMSCLLINEHLNILNFSVDITVQVLTVQQLLQLRNSHSVCISTCLRNLIYSLPSWQSYLSDTAGGGKVVYGTVREIINYCLSQCHHFLLCQQHHCHSAWPSELSRLSLAVSYASCLYCCYADGVLTVQQSGG